MTAKEVHHDLIVQAARLLRQGKLVAFPTETVYGLGANASNAEALRRLYAAKGRPANHPVIVHIHSLEMISNWAKDVPQSCFALARAFWPGPLTVILKRQEGILDEVTGGQDTIAIRIPNHPLALSLLREFGGGLAAPSANKFGRLSPTQARHVKDEFGDEVALVLDGGACEVGIESTIVDLSQNSPRILRPGMLTAESIAKAIDSPNNQKFAAPDDQVRAPGSLPSHYAPETPLKMVDSESLTECLQQHLAENKAVSVISFQRPDWRFSAESWIFMSSEPAEFARQIYSCLRQLDSKLFDLIVVESPPVGDERWSGVLDRLKRASHQA